ncbi:hypothetical protein MNL06_05835 [Bartonella krasnovii]|uniref:hypothetical protein n=1 Tax=Bartonella krasnovii TaxID=2267275 RepID=UPI001F4CF199|nr:hypothetical protein [Bartonella krasnovii]UNF45081.1 hypothetical protein MNL06_05835 [Bartonella krasnovii]
MKIKFDPNQHHQRRAWESAVGIFKGQELDKTLFSMPSLTKHEFEAYLTGKGERGYGNRLCLSPEEILENVQNIQLRNGLKQTKELKSLDFTIEMENH